MVSHRMSSPGSPGRTRLLATLALVVLLLPACSDPVSLQEEAAKSAQDRESTVEPGRAAGADAVGTQDDPASDDPVAGDDPVDDPAEPVPVCHVPPGNPANAHTIWVGPHAVAAHLAHGDVEGECPAGEGDVEGPGEEEPGDTPGTLVGNYPDPDHPEKVLICHAPPGNPTNAHTLSVSPHALNGHAGHPFDYDGPCTDDAGEDAGDPGTDDDGGEAGAGESVPVCHVPPGNPANAHTIWVGPHAVAAHLAHGDSAGECSG